MSAADASAANDERVAVIGLSCRFPGAPDVAAFWANITAGVESIAVGGPDAEGRVVAAATLPAIDRFDPVAFGCSEEEAARLDPQHRLLLECAAEAMESAGHPGVGSDARPVGVYCGTGPSTYVLNNLLPREAGTAATCFLNSSSGLDALVASDKDFATARIAYALNLTGPAVSVQAACATGLVAVHVAVQAILAGECEMAIAAAASIPVPQITDHAADSPLLSADGHCRAFDAAATGTVFGSGVGAVVLKLLDAAVRDGDPVRAVVLGTSVTNDGGMRIGFDAPTATGQARAVAEAISVSGVDPASIGFVEAHGSATVFGDAVEVAALARGFCTTRRGYCALGSVKANVGHLGWAAALAGFIKAVLVVEHGRLPPAVGFQRPNPEIDFDASPFYVNTGLTPWPAGPGPRRAGVNAFGLGGTNAHVIIESAPPRPSRRVGSGGWHVVPMSASSPEALATLLRRYAAHLGEHPDLEVGDIAFTAGTGRAHHPFRAAFPGAEIVDILRGIRSWDVEPAPCAASPRVGFTMETAYVPPDVAARIRSEHALAAEVFDRAEVLDATGPAGRTVAARIGLAALWRSWGVHPVAVVGDGMIERLVADWGEGVRSIDEVLLAARAVDSGEATDIRAENRPAVDADVWLDLSVVDGRAMALALADLYTKGTAVDWEAVAAARGAEPHRVPLPTTPFRRVLCWIGPPEPDTAGAPG